MLHTPLSIAPHRANRKPTLSSFSLVQSHFVDGQTFISVGHIIVLTSCKTVKPGISIFPSTCPWFYHPWIFIVSTSIHCQTCERGGGPRGGALRWTGAGALSAGALRDPRGGGTVTALLDHRHGCRTVSRTTPRKMRGYRFIDLS